MQFYIRFGEIESFITKKLENVRKTIMVKIGLLGAGRVIQSRYMEVFKQELKDVSVLIVCDKVKTSADKVASILECQAVYNDELLFKNSEIDTILIATESGNHYEHAKRALEKGKHVIVEKPPAFNPEEILNNEKFAKEKGLMFAVIFQNRLNPAIQILKKTYDDGRFGKLVLATIRVRTN